MKQGGKGIERLGDQSLSKPWLQPLSALEGTDALDRVIEAIVDAIGWFGAKDATSYLEAYRAEMVMRLGA